MSAGLAALNGDQRGQLFVQFMRQRADSSTNSQLSPKLRQLLKQNVLKLKERHTFAAVLVIPSRTWQQRETTATYIADLLGIKAYPNLLAWTDMPPARQGELLNNDQRRHNVNGKMKLTGPLTRPGAPPPSKAILLLDDYIGSGATLKEAVRVLRKEGGFTADIAPFTVACVRWRIGARGMI